MGKNFLIFLICVIIFIGANLQRAKTQNIPLPTDAQLAWHYTERIMFVHWGPATWQGREYDNHTTDLNDINPSQYNTDQWCQTARSWGASLIIFVAKHVGGFCWWQTQTSDYGVRQLGWQDGKADVMRDLANSCKKYGLRLGVYIYPGDERWTAGIGSGGICEDTSKQEAYNKVFRQQLTEVLSNYGQISEVWFDGNCKIPVGDILKQYAPNAVVFQGENASLRWVGNEDGIAPYPNWYTLNDEDLRLGNATALASDINGNAYAPVEVDIPLLKHGGHKWFFSPDSDSLLLSVEELMNIYYNSVGRGSVLLLNATPDTSGLIPQSHCDIYKAFGEEINKRFLFPVRFVSGKATSIRMQWKEPKNVNHVIIQEDLTFGQRVLEYEVRGRAGNKWVSLCKGTSVGSKRIQFFDNIVLDAMELKILNSKDIPVIKLFAAYDVQTQLNDLQAKHTLAEPQQVGFWNKATINSQKYNEITVDLTDFAYKTGQYILSFNQLSMDYFSDKSSELDFKDVQLEMYGKTHSLTAKNKSNTIKQIASNQFLITHSQQTLKESPVVFKAKVRHRGADSIGEITLKKVSY